jgi:surfactin synthase thioesterase subunit
LQIRISAADFFKEPTLKFLSRATLKTETNNLIWKLKEGNSRKELWLLPPIMGFGFIFNSLNLPEDWHSYAFSYPAAMGEHSCKSIEEIARMLLGERIALGELPEEVMLLGYSMGGLTAFEMAKWLEDNNVKVKKLIILDKTAQPEYGKIVQKVDLKGELMEIARQIAADAKDYNRIIDYLRTHESLIEAYQQQGFVSCPIEVFYCVQGFAIADFLKWQRFSSAELKIQSIANCSHYEIPKIWNELNFEF